MSIRQNEIIWPEKPEEKKPEPKKPVKRKPAKRSEGSE